MRRQISRVDARPRLARRPARPEDGFALARWLRETTPRVGIIMLTAAADPVDKVLGLESGADDYVAKPYEPRELLARCRSVLRRSVNKSTPSRLERCCAWAGTCSTCPSASSYDAENADVPLTSGEFDILEDLRRESQPAAVARLAARDDQPPRPRSVRPGDRPADHAHPPQDRAGARQADGDPHCARRRLYVRAARRIAAL